MREGQTPENTKIPMYFAQDLNNFKDGNIDANIEKLREEQKKGDGELPIPAVSAIHDVPGDGNCMYHAIMSGYLQSLIAEKDNDALEKLKKEYKDSYNTMLSQLEFKDSAQIELLYNPTEFSAIINDIIGKDEDPISTKITRLIQALNFKDEKSDFALSLVAYLRYKMLKCAPKGEKKNAIKYMGEYGDTDYCQSAANALNANIADYSLETGSGIVLTPKSEPEPESKHTVVIIHHAAKEHFYQGQTKAVSEKFPNPSVPSAYLTGIKNDDKNDHCKILVSPNEAFQKLKNARDEKNKIIDAVKDKNPKEIIELITALQAEIKNPSPPGINKPQKGKKKNKSDDKAASIIKILNEEKFEALRLYLISAKFAFPTHKENKRQGGNKDDSHKISNLIGKSEQFPDKLETIENILKNHQEKQKSIEITKYRDKVISSAGEDKKDIASRIEKIISATIKEKTVEEIIKELNQNEFNTLVVFLRKMGLIEKNGDPINIKNFDTFKSDLKKIQEVLKAEEAKEEATKKQEAEGKSDTAPLFTGGEKEYRNLVLSTFSDIISGFEEKNLKIEINGNKRTATYKGNDAYIEHRSPKGEDASVHVKGFGDKSQDVKALLMYLKTLAEKYGEGQKHTWRIEKPELSQDNLDKLVNEVFNGKERLLEKIKFVSSSEPPVSAREISEKPDVDSLLSEKNHTELLKLVKKGGLSDEDEIVKVVKAAVGFLKSDPKYAKQWEEVINACMENENSKQVAIKTYSAAMKDVSKPGWLSKNPQYEYLKKLIVEHDKNVNAILTEASASLTPAVISALLDDSEVKEKALVETIIKMLELKHKDDSNLLSKQMQTAIEKDILTVLPELMKKCGIDQLKQLINSNRGRAISNHPKATDILLFDPKNGILVKESLGTDGKKFEDLKDLNLIKYAVERIKQGTEKDNGDIEIGNSTVAAETIRNLTKALARSHSANSNIKQDLLKQLANLKAIKDEKELTTVRAIMEAEYNLLHPASSSVSETPTRLENVPIEAVSAKAVKSSVIPFAAIIATEALREKSNENNIKAAAQLITQLGRISSTGHNVKSIQVADAAIGLFINKINIGQMSTVKPDSVQIKL